MASPIQQQIEKLRPPSKLKYFFFGLIALLGDIADILAVLLSTAAIATAVGAPVAAAIIETAFIIDLIIAPILFFAGWRTNSRIKAMRRAIDDLHIHIEKINRRIIQIRRYYAASIRLARRIPGLRRTVRRTVLALRKVRLGVVRNPIFKNTAAIVADFIPYLDVIPWRTAAIYFAYRDEKRSYEETIESAKAALAVESQATQYELEVRNELSAA